MKHELLDCPHCGEPAEMDTQRAFRSLQEGEIGTAVAIYCTRCPADMSLCRGDFTQLSDETLIALAVETWNKRDGQKFRLTEAGWREDRPNA